MLHSIYDLTTFCRKTAGDVPARLVGASTTVVGSKMYLFGGRLVTERKMVSDLYAFDLETFHWEKIPTFAEDDVPRARYFHSADTWNNQLMIFGGMSNQPDSENPDDLCVLNDVRFFDIATRRWLPDALSSVLPDDSLTPRARYAHLSSVTADRLFIVGGQDFNNTWLDDICVYDLVGKAWVQRRDYPRHCGTYRSVAVSSTSAVRFPQEEIRNSQSASTLGPPGQRFGPDMDSPSSPEFTTTESLIHQPYSAPPSDDHPSDIYLYSNYNFTDVKRELEVFSPLPDTDFTIQDRSSTMTGANLPPGLRFPTGAILGTHLIIAGTYLAHSYQSFSIWALDLQTMTWSRIESGKAVESGSWFRGCLWPEGNRFFIFGNRNGNLVDDYNRRLLSWDHVAVVDLEAFGIYQPPPLKLDITMQELGLATLEERVVADFEIVCDDGRKLACSRAILEDRWPWFKEQRTKFMQTAKETVETLPSSSMHVGLPELTGAAPDKGSRLDPRLTPRSFHVSEPYPIVLALLQYFYTTALVTPLQHAPAVLSQLLVLATNYHITHLTLLVKHAMHRALSNSTSVGVYEVATLCSCRSLQIRALKAVMSYTQKRPAKSRGDKDHAGGGGKPTGGGNGGPSNGGGGSNSGSEPQYVARPRGTSDARWRNLSNAESSNSDYNSRSNAIVEEDQVSPLPVLGRQRSQRHNSRPRSIVSIHTETEIHELADYMSDLADIGEPRHRSAEPSSSAAPLRIEPTPSLDSTRHSTTTFSDSDQEYSSSSYHSRPRPRIFTDSLHSPPSLTSSTSRSSLSTGDHVSIAPVTPLTSSSEMPASDLTIIDESYSDDSQFNPDILESFDSTHDLLAEAWPQKKSNIHWDVTQPFTLNIPSSPTIRPPASDQSDSPVSLHLPITPRSASTVSFSRFLSKGRKHGHSDESRAAIIEEKRRKKELKKERARVKKEKMLKEMRQRNEHMKNVYGGGDIGGMHPLVLGTMLAMGQ